VLHARKAKHRLFPRVALHLCFWWSGDDDAQIGAKRLVAERYMPSGHNILTTFSYGFQILLVSKVTCLAPLSSTSEHGIAIAVFKVLAFSCTLA